MARQDDWTIPTAYPGFWYQNRQGEYIHVHGMNDAALRDILESIQARIDASPFKYLWWIKHERACEGLSFTLFMRLIRNGYITARKNPKAFITQMDGKVVFWKLEVRLTAKAQAMIGDAEKEKE